MYSENRDGQPLRAGHFLGLKFDGGWWFIQILNNSVEELKPWQFLNENNNRDVIASQTAGSEDSVEDENNDKLLEPNDDERSLVFQILVGTAPSRVQLFPQFGREQNLGLESSIQPGEDEMWVTGYDSPYNAATEQGEVFYINDMSPLRFVAYNPTDEPLPAKASFFINKLNYATVTDIDMMKAMLQNQITSKKHPMGLGATDSDQLDIPQWLEVAFGEHIYTTKEIMANGDTSRVTNDLDFRNNTQLMSQGGN